MMLTSTLLAMVLLGATPSGHPTLETAPESGFRVKCRVMSMKGLDWRGPMHSRLVPAARQGTSTVWTANKDVVESLVKSSDSVTTSQDLRGTQDAPVRLEDVTVRGVVADVRRVADGPPGQNSAVAFVPVIDPFRDAFQAEISCRKADQGLVLKLDLADSRVSAIHTYSIADGVTDPKTKKFTAMNAQAQVAEVVSSHVEGEWLVPTDSILIVSLGVDTSADASGKAVTRERLALIEPTISDPDVIQAIHAPASRPRVAADLKAAPAVIRALTPPVPIGRSPLPTLAMPYPDAKSDRAPLPPTAVEREPVGKSITIVALPLPLVRFPLLDLQVAYRAAIAPPDATLPSAVPPARGLPRAVAVDGSDVDLPPLPGENEIVVPDSDDESRPSPQARPRTGSTVPSQAERIDPRPGMIRHLDVLSPDQSDEFAFTRRPVRRTVARDQTTHLGDLVCDDLVLFPAPEAPRISTGPAETIGCPLAPADPGVDFKDIAPSHAGGWKGTSSALNASDRSLLRSHFAGRVLRELMAATEDEEPSSQADASTIGVRLKSADGECQYESEVKLRSVGTEPIVVSVPMPDGSVVEVQAKIVKKPGGKR